MSLINLPGRFKWVLIVSVVVLVGLFKINLLSAGWNIVAALIISAVVLLLLGDIGGDD
jgi:hypothetical protein